jgi:hypothetical protein
MRVRNMGFISRFGIVLQLMVLGACGAHTTNASTGEFPIEASEPAAPQHDVAESEDPLTPFAEQAGCTSEERMRKKGRATNGCWYPKYNGYARELITESSTFVTGPAPADIAEVCPNYERLSIREKQTFWVYFVQALTAIESGFNKYVHLPENKYDKKTGEQVISEGLLQLSYSDRGRGPGCVFNKRRDAGLPESERSIFKAKNNLQCGISILDWQLFEKGRPLFTNRSYWAPLHKRAKSRGYKVCMRKAKGDTEKELECQMTYHREYAACMRKANGVPENEVGCQGLFNRRILSQFWDGYPMDKRLPGKNLCGLQNHLSFCGQLACQESQSRVASLE